MPLKANFNGNDIYSFFFSNDEWDELKKNYRDGALKMSCCDSLGVPKTSPRGLFFFQHKTKGSDCSVPESAEHEYVKFLIAKIAHETGWKVDTEHCGTSPDSEDWRADVFCEKGKAKLAFEVQHSKITIQEIQERQKRYRESGVRGAWIVNGLVFKTDALMSYQRAEVPIFPYILKEVGTVPMIDFFNITLPAFIDAMLNKHLKWKETVRSVCVNVAEHTCWKCQQTTKSVIGLDGEWDKDRFVEKGEDISYEIREVINKCITSDEFLALHGIGKIEECNYRSGERFYSPRCYHCNAVQGVHQLVNDIWSYSNPYSKKETSIMNINMVPFSPNESGFYNHEERGHWTFYGKPFLTVETQS